MARFGFWISLAEQGVMLGLICSGEGDYIRCTQDNLNQYRVKSIYKAFKQRSAWICCLFYNPYSHSSMFFLDVRQCCVKKTWDLRSSVSECWSQICRKLSTNLELSHCPNSISPLRSAVTDLRLLRHWDETVSLGHGSPESPSAFTDSSESHRSPSIHSVASEATHPVSLSRDLWPQASCTQAAGLWGSRAALLQPA